MKKLILAALLLPNLTAFGQSYCAPLTESRVVYERALKSIGLDVIVNEQAGKIITLENSLESQHASFTKELAETNDKLKIQKEITSHAESISQVYKEENTHLKKKVRGLKWQRAGLGIAVIAVLILGNAQ